MATLSDLNDVLQGIPNSDPRETTSLQDLLAAIQSARGTEQQRIAEDPVRQRDIYRGIYGSPSDEDLARAKAAKLGAVDRLDEKQLPALLQLIQQNRTENLDQMQGKSNPIQDPYAGKRVDPTVSTAYENNELSQPGVDFQNPEHRALVKSVVQKALAKGEAVDPYELQKEITSTIRKDKLKILQDKSAEAALYAQTAESMKKVRDANQTGRELPKATLTKIENDLFDGYKMERNLVELKNDFNEDFFTYYTKAKIDALRAAEKSRVDLSDDQKAFQRDYSAYQTRVQGLFTQFRKWSTGVAFSQQEIAQLEQIFINMNMSPSQAQGALDALIAGNKYNNKLSELYIQHRGNTKDLDEYAQTDPEFKAIRDEWNAKRSVLKDMARNPGVSERLKDVQVTPELKAQAEAELKRRQALKQANSAQ